ncbi:MAG TPA: GGDEF domain-containing protein [Devosia sp.]|jgi:diguanylate cyclase (GGDEF)-like protein|nr:GGDEF domain-containing protein [Devosia sp.]
MKLDLSAESWGRVIVYTVLGTLVCVVAALYVDSFNFAHYSDEERTRAIIIDIALPIVLAVPLLLFFTGKLRELAIAHKKLTIYASTDTLTEVMNRAAFSTLVDAYLKQVQNTDGHSTGAFLLIDADNFKTVNDRFGHDSGDQALITIAQSIKSMLRGPDLVGRLGGEEFGVFLPGANTEQATQVAERIRQSVSAAKFTAAGGEHPLSVSVGGAVFERKLPYAELFRLADQQLYAAKREGRNRVAIAPIRPGPISLVAA